MGKNFDFDYIIIGSGPAGRTAALNLAKKKKVALVEGKTFGGSDLNSRDIPYLTNLNFANSYYRLKNFPATAGSDIHFNFPTLISHQNYVSNLIATEQKKALETAGVTCLSGHAHFLDKNTIAVGQSEYTARSFIIATGSKLKTGEIAGLDTVNHLTPDTALKVSRLPRCALVIGGGSTGCEIANYYAALGSKVIIMERSSRLLPREDKEVSDELTNYFTNELGIMVIPEARVVAIEQDGMVKRVIFTADGKEKMVRIDCIVFATGSEPNLDLGLENAGVKYKRSGILVNKFFETSAKNIYAIGDCLNRFDSSTELAEYEATLLTSNLLQKPKAVPNYNGFIRMTNTYPEIAVVGENERDILAADKKARRAIIYLKDLPSAKIENLDTGFVKLIADKDDHLLGATIVAPNASLLAEELSLVLRHRINLAEVASTPHGALSFNTAIKLAARKLVK